MSNVFSLDDLREAAEKRYAPVKLSIGDDLIVELVSVFRLGETDRKKVFDIVDEINKVTETDDDELTDEEAQEYVCEFVADILGIVANKPKKLIAALDHEDPAIKADLHMQVLSYWMKELQLGEAVPSPSS